MLYAVFLCWDWPVLNLPLEMLGTKTTNIEISFTTKHKLPEIFFKLSTEVGINTAISTSCPTWQVTSKHCCEKEVHMHRNCTEGMSAECYLYPVAGMVHRVPLHSAGHRHLLITLMVHVPATLICRRWWSCSLQPSKV